MTERAAATPETAPTSVAKLIRGPLFAVAWQIAALSFFVNALALAAPVFSIQVFDRVIPHSGVETLKALVIAVVALIGFDFVMRQARAGLVQSIALKVDIALTRAIFARLTGLPLRRLEETTTSEWRLLMRDGEAVRDAVAGPTLLLCVDLPFALLFIGLIALVAPPLAVVLLVVAPLSAILAAISSTVLRRAGREEQGAGEARHRLATELVGARATVKALGLGAHLQARWERLQAAAIASSATRGAKADLFSTAGASLGMATSIAMTTVGAMAIIGQEMTIGALIAANMIAGRVLQPVTQLIGLWRSAERFAEARRRLDALLAEAPERAESWLERPRPRGVLSLDGVRFSYDAAGATVLQSITAQFAPGRMIGVLGANGSGKSTLLKIIQGLYEPSAGCVRLDDAELSQFTRGELARWIGYAPQETALFAGAIRDNIAGGREDVDDAVVLAAAKAAGADAMIAGLPEGYGTEVGEAGRRLSLGQRQRVALARALLEDPPILLLDEPSANLDFQAEAELRARLAALKAGRTVIVASHSRPLLEACDELIVLQGGKIVMRGPSAEVLPKRAPAQAVAPTRTKRPPKRAEARRPK